MKEHISEVSKLVLQVKPRGLMPLSRFLLIEAAQVFKAALKVLRRQQGLSRGVPQGSVLSPLCICSLWVRGSYWFYSVSFSTVQHLV